MRYSVKGNGQLPDGSIIFHKIFKKKERKKKKLHNLIQVLVSDSILMAILAKYILLHLLYFAKTYFKNKALTVKT